MCASVDGFGPYDGRWEGCLWTGSAVSFRPAEMSGWTGDGGMLCWIMYESRLEVCRCIRRIELVFRRERERAV